MTELHPKRIQFKTLSSKDICDFKGHSLFVTATIGEQFIADLSDGCRWIGVHKIGFASGFDSAYDKVYVAPREVIPQLSNVADQVLRISGNASESFAARLLVKEIEVFDFALRSEVDISCVEVALSVSSETAQKIIAECRAHLRSGPFPKVDFILRITVDAFDFPAVRGSLDSVPGGVGPFAVLCDKLVDEFDFLIVRRNSDIEDAKADESAMRNCSFVSGIRVSCSSTPGR